MKKRKQRYKIALLATTMLNTIEVLSSMALTDIGN